MKKSNFLSKSNLFEDRCATAQLEIIGTRGSAINKGDVIIQAAQVTTGIMRVGTGQSERAVNPVGEHSLGANE